MTIKISRLFHLGISWNRLELILSAIQARSSSNSTVGNTERKVVDISRIFSTVEATGYGNLPVGQVKVSRPQVDEHSRINRKERKKKTIGDNRETNRDKNLRLEETLESLFKRIESFLLNYKIISRWNKIF